MKTRRLLRHVSGWIFGTIVLGFLQPGLAWQATTVPNEIQMPGTQPFERVPLDLPSHCDNCHGGYDQAVEPAHNWRGSMMAQATRDPIFWASMAVAEQDFSGSGDLCLRCHTTTGWPDGRSTPTDGSALLDDDAYGVVCHLCHAQTDPDDSEHLGIQNAPFIANDGGAPAEGFYGNGMFVLWAGSDRIGPYADPVSPHDDLQSEFHRSSELCGTCHDVSNPAVGDLAPGNGAQTPLLPGSFDGTLGGPLAQKAAFNNPPYAYGIVERTFSEHQASAFADLLVDDYDTLPAELQAGSIQRAYLAATAVRPDGYYADGTPRTFSCQSCHVPPVTGKGCKQNQAPVRSDLPFHDMTGGNYWMPDAIQYLDNLGQLRLGGGLSSDEIAAMTDGQARARQNLALSATLDLDGNTLRVVNLTGHKLISGYPEGRRMWLRIEWRDGGEQVLRTDGEYGALTVDIGGTPTQVQTLLDLHDPNTRVYEAHLGMTQEWADKLVTLGSPTSLALAYDRVTGSVTTTLGDLAGQSPGTSLETFHFVLNNTIVKDSRIPPFGMEYDDALERNILPVPANQYGAPISGGTYRYWDELELTPPAEAATATIELLYQPTSWEYIQFLSLANDNSITFLANEGQYLLDAWLNTGMAEPEVMTSTIWTAPSPFSSYCFGTVATCPCGNGGAADTGCDNAQGTGGVALDATGDPSTNTVVLEGSGYPTTTTPSAVVIRSPAREDPPVVFGDGLRCIALPGLVRFGATAASAGTSLHPINHGAGPGTFQYQLWYRNTPVTFCDTAAAFNLSSGLTIVWP